MYNKVNFQSKLNYIFISILALSFFIIELGLINYIKQITVSTQINLYKNYLRELNFSSIKNNKQKLHNISHKLSALGYQINKLNITDNSSKETQSYSLNKFIKSEKSNIIIYKELKTLCSVITCENLSIVSEWNEDFNNQSFNIKVYMTPFILLEIWSDIEDKLLFILSFWPLILIILSYLLLSKHSSDIETIADCIHKNLSTPKINQTPIKYDTTFQELNIIIKSFNFLINEKQKIQEIKDIKDIAKLVEHDLKSPSECLKMVLNEIDSKLNPYDDLKDILKMSIIRVEEILFSLKSELSLEVDYKENILVLPLLKDIIYEKKFEFKYDPNINILLKYDNKIEKIQFILHRKIFKRVISNIINNSKDALQNNYNGIVLVTIKLKNNELIISIIDNGIGIPNKYLSDVGKKYFSLKSESGGKGLGLSHAFDYIKSIRGRICIKSIENRYTSVQIFIPILKE